MSYITTANSSSPSIGESKPPLSQYRLLILESLAVSSTFSTSASTPTPATPRISLIPSLLRALTGHAPPEDPQGKSLAGYTTHSPLRVCNRYFDIQVGLWCDEVPLPRPEEEWKDENRVSGGEGIQVHDGSWHVNRRSVAEPELVQARAEVAETGPAGHTEDGPDRTQDEQEEATEKYEGDCFGDYVTAENGGHNSKTWLSQMLSPQASEVRGVIGAIVLTLPIPLALERISQDRLETTQNPLRGSGQSDDDECYHDAGPLSSSSSSSSSLDRGCWKLNDTYLSLISTVDKLRSAIEDDRAGSDVENEGSSHADLGAILVLQGQLPSPSPSPWTPRRRSNPHLQAGTTSQPNMPAAQDPADDLIEAVEEQLLTERSVMGWDVILWDGSGGGHPQPSAPAISTPSTASKAGKAEEEETMFTATPESQQQQQQLPQHFNIYGEKTGIDRLKEILDTVDWSSTPSTQDTHHDNYDTYHHHQSPSLDFLSSSSSSSSSPSEHREYHHQDYHTDKKTNTTTDKQEHQHQPNPRPSPTRQEEQDADLDPDSDLPVEQLQGLLDQAVGIRDTAGQLPPGPRRDRYARVMVDRLVRKVR